MTARFLVVLFMVISSWFAVGTVHAQNNQDNSLINSPETSLAKPITTNFPNQSPQYANMVVINLIHTFSCLAEGVSVIGQPCIEYRYQTSGPKAGTFAPQETLYASGGALGSIAVVVSTIYDSPPLSTTEYLADASRGMGIISPALAQVGGSGQNVLFPVLEIWKVTRNIAYLAITFIFLIIGFMIMFRQKINPQTVISAQNALPGLVIGLILITFSYFFAALTVDITFLATRVAGKVFEQGGIIQKDKSDQLLKDGNILNLYSKFIQPDGNQLETVVSTTYDSVESLRKEGAVGQVVEGAADIGGCLLATKITPLKSGVAKIGSKIGISLLKAIPFAGDAIAESIGWIATCAIGSSIVHYLIMPSGIPQTFVGFILYVVLIVALLIAMFKVLFALIVAYITILINTITAPLIFLMGSIPGRQGAFGGWLKTMMANLLIFPAIFAALLFAAYLLFLSGEPFFIQKGPGNFEGTVPLLGKMSPEFLRALFAYGVLLMTPAIPDAIKGAFGVKDNPLFGKAILGGAMGGLGVLQAGYSKWTAPMKKEQQAYEDEKLKRRIAPPTGGLVQPKRKFPWFYP